MLKQVIIINKNGKPTEVCELKLFKDSKELLEMKQICDSNKKEYEDSKAREKSELVGMIQQLSEKCKELEERLHNAEIELKYNRGEITETEYNELCGNK